MIEIPQHLPDLLDLGRAWRRVWRDRASDFVVPSLVYYAIRSDSAAFIDSLRAELLSGRYVASPVRVVEVPKPNHTTRPAGILDVKDRVFYQALVDQVADVATPKLLGPPTVFGFSVNPDADSDEFLVGGGYSEFRQRVAEDFASGYQNVLETDVSAFFECIEDKFLQDVLLGLGIEASIVEALTRLLGHWSRLVPIGLPQGVWPSDYLGTRIYLDRLDKGMRHRGYRFFRYSDDLRVMGKTRLRIRKALRDLVTELRALGLHVQSAKTRLLPPTAARRSIDRLRERLAKRHDLGELLDLDPYGYTSAEESLSELTEDEITQSEALLDALMEEAYGDGTRPDFELCRTCITGYTRIESANALGAALDLLMKLPALTEKLVRYLRVIASKSNATRIKNRALHVLLHVTTIYVWQKHWLLYMLNHDELQGRLSAGNVGAIFNLAIDRNLSWIVRVMAIRLIASVGVEAQIRQLRDMYQEESSADVRHAILLSFRRLARSERTRLFRLAQGADPETDLVISYLKARLDA